jgi:hypothetical protein
MPPFAIVDRARFGSVLMIVDDRDDAEAIADNLRLAHLDIAIIEHTGERETPLPEPG